MSELVTVTGASGFIACHIVEQLLASGFPVRGTVRRPEDAARYRYLTELDDDGRLNLYAGDLTEPDSFHDAIAGTSVVMHTASPYIVNVADPQRDLVDPAVQGTVDVLRTAARCPSVRRVVLTSSMAAITDSPPDRVLSEEDWNTESSLTRNPYYYSKTLAERAAWQFMAAEQPHFDLVVINPFLVVGPAHNPDAINESNQLLINLLTGAMPAIVQLSFGWVDVRDVAWSHIRAMQVPEASGRYLCAAESRDLKEIVTLLSTAGFHRYRLPWLDLTGPVGTALARFSARFEDAGTRSLMETNLGRRVRFDNHRITDELGVRFRPLLDTLQETIADLILHGHLPRC